MMHCPNTTKREAEEIRKMVFQCLRVLARKENEIGFDYRGAKSHADKVLQVVRRGSGRSFAGAHRITINLAWTSLLHFREYKSFADDPTIGSIKVPDSYHHRLALVAHEVSHHVQFAYLPRMPRMRDLYRKPHGTGFKFCYRILRRDLVNPKVAAATAERERFLAEGVQ